MKVEHSNEILWDQFIAIKHLTELHNFLVTLEYIKNYWEKGLVI